MYYAGLFLYVFLSSSFNSRITENRIMKFIGSIYVREWLPINVEDDSSTCKEILAIRLCLKVVMHSIAQMTGNFRIKKKQKYLTK